ncbi:MAG: hypothetical protein AVDCRST_MAG24-994 [uncultured Nocardioidaceae bacterium]|uniref:Uncharacterized protein n=1 Tax=uncultured Nocardioidaceae bacterium TaxID=253824 RepID=A0A6J4LL25_9ACTN|nr:MAG: hypothetical protein AVDCRST_MAG24-994 [uncultured Nocardioidaceae bacterium]
MVHHDVRVLAGVWIRTATAGTASRTFRTGSQQSLARRRCTVARPSRLAVTVRCTSLAADVTLSGMRAGSYAGPGSLRLDRSVLRLRIVLHIWRSGGCI